MPEQQRREPPSLEIVKKERERLRKQKQNRKTALNVLGLLIVVAAISMIISTRFLPVLQVSGSSMEPTLQEGELLVFTKTDKIKSQDIIAFYYQNKILIKRVIGLPGDYIEINNDGRVMVNGQEMKEPYVADFSLGDCDIEFPYYVPKGKYFVLGDHRTISVDSRNSMIGCVSEEQIIGKAQLRLWPVRHVKSFQ